MDEPTTGLDPVVRNEILDIFREYLNDEDNSILLSSHITSDLDKIADCVTFIDNGKRLLTGSIYPASFCHMVHNNLSVEILILLFVSEARQETLNNAPGFTNISAFWLLIPFIAPTGVISFVLLVKKG